MRRQNVRILIKHVKSNLERIRIEYEASIEAEAIRPELQIDVKNVMENLRSALEYMAHDIYEKIVQPHRVDAGKRPLKNIYFPYGKDKSSFNTRLKNSLPELGSLSSAVLSVIENIQPYKCGNNWLYDLCTIVNQNKHDNLWPQKKRVHPLRYALGLRDGPPVISAPPGAISAPPGALKIGGKPVFFDPNTGIPLSTAGLDVKITVWATFLFADTDVEVIPLLGLATKEIEQLASKIYSII